MRQRVLLLPAIAAIAVAVPTALVWGGAATDDGPVTVRPEPPTVKRPVGVGGAADEEGGGRIPVTVAAPRMGTVTEGDTIVRPADFDIARPLAGRGPEVTLAGERPGPRALAGWTEHSSFEGLDLADIVAADAGGGWPPDPTLAVGRTGGATRIIEWVNTGFTILDGSGVALAGPFKGSAVWQGFGGVCETSNAGDPLVRYDQWAQRWVMSQFAFATSGGSPVSPYYQCIAVSRTSDPQGEWARWSYNWSGDFPDYGKLGMTPEGYFITLNMFPDDPAADVHSGVLAFDRQALIAGSPSAQGVYTSLDGTYFGILPADPEGPQPTSTDGLPMAMLGSSMWSTGIASNITMLRANPDFTGGTMAITVTQQVPVPNAYIACLGSGGDYNPCVPQPGSTTASGTTSPKYLDGLGDRLMYRLAWRRVGAEERLVVVYTGSPAVRSGGVATARPTQVRWTILTRPSSGLWVRGEFGATATAASGASADFRWMPSAALDSSGGMVMVYGAANHVDAYASMRISGHAPEDGAGTQDGGGLKPEATVKAGVATQNNVGRWGDYFTAISDPVAACRVWAVGQFMAADPGTRPNNWGTWITEAQDPNCAGRPIPAALPAMPAAPRVGRALTPTAPEFTTIGGSPLAPALAYRWLACTDTATSVSCAPIGGATAASYTPESADLGTRLRLEVTATAAGGQMQTAVSAPSAAVAAPVEPDAPGSVSADAATATSATVRFVPAADDGGADVSSFLASCASDDGGAAGAGSAPAAPVTVAGLTAGRTYTCTVRALNSVGYSVPSAASAPFAMPAAAPAPAPTGGTSAPGSTPAPTPPVIPVAPVAPQAVVTIRIGATAPTGRLAAAAGLRRPPGSRTSLRVIGGPKGGLRVTRAGAKASKVGTYRVRVTVTTKAGKRTSGVVPVTVR